MDSPIGAIPWLLLKVVATQQGRAGGQRLTKTTYVQRVNTTGGVKPAAKCASSIDAGNKNFVPYTADYLLQARRVTLLIFVAAEPDVFGPAPDGHI